jgi:hypothetical protein
MKRKVFLAAGILFCVLLQGLSAAGGRQASKTKEWEYDFVDVISYKVNGVELRENIKSSSTAAFLTASRGDGFTIILEFKDNSEISLSFKFSDVTQDASGEIRANLVDGSLSNTSANQRISASGWSGSFVSRNNLGTQLESMVVSDSGTGPIQGQQTQKTTVSLEWGAKPK